MTDSPQNTPEGQEPYNTNPELVNMKQNIADRSYAVMVKQMVIGGLATVGGAALGVIAAPIGFSPVIAGLTGGMLGMFGGAAASDLVTFKERAKLKIDEEMVQSYMSGKNYWGHGYRQEVAEQGYGFGREPHERAPETPNVSANPDPRRARRGGMFVG